MKKRKKFLKVLSATAIAAIMATTMASTAAFAAVTDTNQYVKMPTNLTGDGTYAIYQVASAAVAYGDNYYDYTVTSKDPSDSAGFETVLKATNSNLYVDGTAGIDGISTDTLLTSGDNSTAQKVAAKLVEVISGNEDPMTDKGTLASGATVSLAPGYYLITYTGSVTAAPMLLAVTSDMNKTTVADPYVLTAKGSEIPLDKSITDISDGQAANNGNTGYGAVGSTVSYKLASKTPSYDTTVTADTLTIPYAITDIPEDTLVITNDTISITVGSTALRRGASEGKTNNFYADDTETTLVATLTEATTADKKDGSTLSFGTGDNAGTGFTLTFDKAYTLAHQGEAVEVTFNAVLTNPAGGTVDTGTNSNDNYAQVSYDNDYYAQSATPTKEEEIVNVFSAEVNVTKTKEDGSALDGAGFTLQIKQPTGDYIDTGISPIITGTSNNEFKFTGLTAGTYKLVETTVPNGYKQAQDIVFKINEDGSVDASFGGNFTYTNEDGSENTNFTVTSGKMSTSVINIAGQSLPGTGGVGTTMFTIGGIALVVVAGGMLTIYMKKRKTSEEE